MPIYEYACGACGNRFEARQSYSDASLTECPRCHGQVKRVLHAVGIVFKGSGFYKNDSRPPEKGESGTEGSAAEEKAKKEATAGASEPKAEGKTETKATESKEAGGKEASATPAKPATTPPSSAPSGRTADN